MTLNHTGGIVFEKGLPALPIRLDVLLVGRTKSHEALFNLNSDIALSCGCVAWMEARAMEALSMKSNVSARLRKSSKGKERGGERWNLVHGIDGDGSRGKGQERGRERWKWSRRRRTVVLIDGGTRVSCTRGDALSRICCRLPEPA